MGIIKRQGLTIRVYDVHPDGTVTELIPRTTLVRPSEVHLYGEAFGVRTSPSAPRTSPSPKPTPGARQPASTTDSATTCADPGPPSAP